MGQYSWLADKKREAVAAKLQQRGMPNYAQLPIRERYGVSYTGTGADGKVDKNAPAGMAGAPGQQHIYHEGEMRAHIPEGDMYVNAETTQKMMMAPTNQDNMEMNMNQKKGNLPGYATGGFAPTVPTIPKMPTNILVQPTQRQGLANTAANLAGQISNQVNTTTRRTSSSAVPTDVQTPASAPTNTPVTTPNQPDITMPAINRTVPKVEPVQIAPVQAPAAQTMTVAPRTVPKVEVAQFAPVEAPAAQTVAPVVRKAPDVAPIQLAGQQQGTAPVTPVAPVQTAEDKARATGLDYLQGTLTGQTGVQLEGQKALDELTARQQQERSAAEQRAVQEGLSPDRARAEAQILRNTQEGEANALAAKYGIAGMQEKAATAGTLASQGLAGQQFEDDKKKYGDSADWKAYETAIAAGDFTTAAQAYKRVTGNDISMDQMRTNQQYLNTKQSQDIASGNLDLDAKRFNLDNSKMQAVINDINNGVPLDTINKTYGTTLTTSDYGSIGEKYAISMDSLRTTLGTQKVGAINDAINKGMTLEQINQQFPDAKLSMAQYKAMYNATPLGDKTWERDMSFAKTLLEAGGPENIANAAKMFNNAFPGTGIDFSKLVTQDKANTFNQGMGQLSDIIASGSMDYNEAKDVLKGNGTFEMMGIDPETPEGQKKMEGIFNGMRVNAIDDQYKELVGSDWWNGTLKDAKGNLIPGPTPEEKSDMQTFMSDVLSGKLDYRIQKEYTVTQDGKTKTMYFNTEADANKYALDNKGTTVVATGQKKVTPVTDILNPEGTGGADQGGLPDVTGKPQGSVVLQGGKAYQVDAAGKPVEVTKVPTDLWGKDATAILDAGETGNPLYTKMVEARTADIIDNGNYQKLKGVKTSDPVYQKALNDTPLKTFSYRNRTGFNDEMVGAPEVDEWVKVKLQDGTEKLLKVTFNGLLNTAGTSDRAYMEFQDPDGNMYSTQGSSANIGPGVNTKYDKKNK